MNDIVVSISALLDQPDAWIALVFFLVFITLTVAFLLFQLLKHLHVKAKQTKNVWDDHLISAAQFPLSLFILLMGLSFAADVVASYAQADISTVTNAVTSKIREIAVIVMLSWFLLRFVKRMERSYTKPNDSSVDATTARAVGKLLRASVVITALLIIMQSLGYSVSGILAFGGIGGIAIGFAAKDLLANFFGGLMIYLDRPFRVGDWIRSPDRSIEGTVEDIGWRLTRIRTFDKRPLYVPNATFAQISLENPSRMFNRRIKETIGIRYEDAGKMDKIIDDVKNYLLSNEDIDQTQTLIVNFNAFAPSSLDFFIYTFTKTTNWIAFHRIKQQVLLSIIQIIEANDAQCAFPTSTLHIESVPAQTLSSYGNDVK